MINYSTWTIATGLCIAPGAESPVAEPLVGSRIENVGLTVLELFSLRFQEMIYGWKVVPLKAEPTPIQKVDTA